MPPIHLEMFFREKIGKEVVGRAMSPLAILSILIVLVLPVPGEAHDGGDVDFDVDVDAVDGNGEEHCDVYSVHT